MEPTQPAQYPYGFYDSTAYQPNPYELPPFPPPPLPRKSRKLLMISVIMLVAALILFVASALLYLTYLQTANHLQPTNKELTTSTPTNRPAYTADNILEDMINNGCPCTTGIQHDLPPGDFIDNGSGEKTYYISVTAVSSVSWNDQNGGGAGLWVYDDKSDAASAYAQVGKYEQQDLMAGASPNTVSTEEIHNVCLLIILPGNGSDGPPWSGYQQALDQYCI